MHAHVRTSVGSYIYVWANTNATVQWLMTVHASPLQVATFILQKILLDETGLSYICQTYERFSHVATVLVCQNFIHLCIYKIVMHNIVSMTILQCAMIVLH